MNDDAILANILRRGLTQHGFDYWFLGGEVHPTRITIDGHLELSEEELSAVRRMIDDAPEEPA